MLWEGVHNSRFECGKRSGCGAFLQRKIPFLAIEACVEWTLEQYVGLKDSPRMSYEALIDLDDWARETAKEYLDSHVS